MNALLIELSDLAQVVSIILAIVVAAMKVRMAIRHRGIQRIFYIGGAVVFLYLAGIFIISIVGVIPFMPTAGRLLWAGIAALMIFLLAQAVTDDTHFRH